LLLLLLLLSCLYFIIWPFSSLSDC
jgi:hypothetical protein